MTLSGSWGVRRQVAAKRPFMTFVRHVPGQIPPDAAALTKGAELRAGDCGRIGGLTGEVATNWMPHPTKVNCGYGLNSIPCASGNCADQLMVLVWRRM